MLNNKLQKVEQSDKNNSSFILRLRRQSKTLNSTQKFMYKSREQQSCSSNKDKTFPICERKLKARILQLIQNQQQNHRSQTSLTKPTNEKKFDRAYFYHKVIVRPKTKQVNFEEMTLAKIKSICEAKLINLTPKTINTSIKLKSAEMKNLNIHQNYESNPNIFMKMCSVSPKRKIKYIQFPTISFINQCKTETTQKTPIRALGKQKNNIGPWDKQQQFTQVHQNQTF